MTDRLLLVEPSATMRYVLEKHVKSLGFAVDATESYDGSLQMLKNQYQRFGSEYSALLFGWPSTPQDEASKLASVLEQSEYSDLPVLVMSTDLRAETRAWVSGRDNTAVLGWKEYQGVESLLRQLLDVGPEESSPGPAKFDNSDIHLLVVDDSATIRHSLRDLFRMQGYQVTLASTQDDAMELATTNAFDIAVLDFYLQDTTGDQLCRELIASSKTGDIVCTVLTGTYSDHIIKRSLRAGAVECMFKNESSELLLSRIDAISRFVRQQRELQSERKLLVEIIESLAGAVIIVEPNQSISYISTAGVLELQLKSANDLLGRSSQELLEWDGPQSPGTGLHKADWQLPNGDSINVDYEHVLVETSGRSILRFSQRRPAISRENNYVDFPNTDEPTVENAVIQELSLLPESQPFLQEFQQYLNTVESLPDRASLLVLDVFVKTRNGSLLPVSAHSALESAVRSSLHAIYQRPGHVAALQDNRYGFLLRHREEPQAYLLVRKIMQMCLEIKHGFEGVELACAASLVSLSTHSSQSMSLLLDHAFKGADLAISKQANQALLLDLRRMLSAYPEPEVVVTSLHERVAPTRR